MRRAEELHQKRVAETEQGEREKERARERDNPYLQTSTAGHSAKEGRAQGGEQREEEETHRLGGPSGGSGWREIEVLRIVDGRSKSGRLKGGSGVRSLGGVGLECFCDPTTSDVVVETVLAGGPAERSGHVAGQSESESESCWSRVLLRGHACDGPMVVPESN